MSNEQIKNPDAERRRRLMKILSGEARQQILSSARHTLFDARGEGEAKRIAHDVEQRLACNGGVGR